MMSPPTQGRGLKCGEPAAELAGLIGLYARAEVQIVNELGRLRSLGLADYHAEAALNRIRRILLALEGETQRRAGPMIEAPFYADHPEARNRPEPAAKHRRAYEAANDLTAEQSDIVQRLTVNLIGQLAEARLTALATVEQAVLGRLESDVFRRVGLEQTALMEAAGRGAMKQLPEFVEALRRQGLTAFIDKAGRRWSLHGYAGMVLRTTSRQAEILSVLTADPEQDLFQISSHGTTCPLCAPYEGRVYSKSGQDPVFPPLSAAFGKVDPAGPDSLANSWLNIHPNCLHVLLPWTPAGRSPEEIQKIKDFSNPRKNPFSKDPRSQAQIEAYRKKEQARAQWLRDYRQWEKYRAALGDKIPKTFQTFQKHKRAGDGKYAGWLKEYRGAMKAAEELEKRKAIQYNEKQKEAARALILSAQFPKRINSGHQNKHIKSSGHYIPGRSYLYTDLKGAQALVDKYHGTGNPILDRKGNWAHKERILQNEPIGVYVDRETGKKIETNCFLIHYGKNGSHVVPAKEERE